MKKVLFVINTLGGAGAEKALLELLKRFPKEQYEISLYVLLDQGELILQVPSHVKVLNREYSDASVLSREGKKVLNKKIWKRLWIHGAVFRNFPFLIRNTVAMIKKGKISPDKLLWRVMSDSGQVIREHYDIKTDHSEEVAASWDKAAEKEEKEYEKAAEKILKKAVKAIKAAKADQTEQY